jgi:hypothetical protein
VVGGRQTETEKKALMGYFGFAGVTSGVIWDGASQNERFRLRCGCREACTRRAKPEYGNMGFGVNSHARRVTLPICG